MLSSDKQRPDLQENPPCFTQFSETIVNGLFLAVNLSTGFRTTQADNTKFSFQIM